MGKVIIKFSDNHLESFKCKSRKRASEIAGKRIKVREWNYYENNQRIPIPKKKFIEKKEMTKEQIEAIMARNLSF